MPAITRFTLRKLDSLLKGRMEERKERCPVSRDYAGSTVKRGSDEQMPQVCVVQSRNSLDTGEGKLVYHRHFQDNQTNK